MFIASLVVALVAGFVAGLLLKLLSKDLRTTRAKVVSTALAVVLGVIVSTGWHYYNPVGFDHLFSYETWFEWLAFLRAPEYMLLFIFRSALIFPIGMLIGWFFSKPKQSVNYLPIAALTLAFLGTWGIRAEHPESGVETVTHIYRFSDVLNTPKWNEQSEEWVSFLDSSLVPYLGYESYPADYIQNEHSEEHFGGQIPFDAKQGSLFVAIKEYRRGDEVIARVRESQFGYLTASELRDLVRKVQSKRR